jgi:hypothetical protein
LYTVQEKNISPLLLLLLHVGSAADVVAASWTVAVTAAATRGQAVRDHLTSLHQKETDRDIFLPTVLKFPDSDMFLYEVRTDNSVADPDVFGPPNPDPLVLSMDPPSDPSIIKQH